MDEKRLFGIEVKDARVGDRVRSMGYLNDDGWASVVARDGRTAD